MNQVSVCLQATWCKVSLNHPQEPLCAAFDWVWPAARVTRVFWIIAVENTSLLTWRLTMRVNITVIWRLHYIPVSWCFLMKFADFRDRDSVPAVLHWLLRVPSERWCSLPLCRVLESIMDTLLTNSCLATLVKYTLYFVLSKWFFTFPSHSIILHVIFIKCDGNVITWNSRRNIHAE